MTAERSAYQDKGPAKKSRPSRIVAVNFLGSAIREKPDLVEKLDPKSAYVLFTHSDIVNPKSYASLADTLDISTSTVSAIYNKQLLEVWESASEKLQEKYPLTVIFQALGHPTDEERAKMSEGQRRRYQNPEQRRINRDTQQAIAQTPKQKAIYERFSRERKGKSPPKAVRIKMTNSQKKRYENNPQLREALRQHMIDRYANPEERQKAAKRQELLPLGKWRKQQIAGMSKKQQQRVRSIDLYDYELWQAFQLNHIDSDILATGVISFGEIARLRKYFTGEITVDNIQILLDKFSIALARVG